MGGKFLSQEVAPAMIEAGRGAILITGNTSATRGKVRFAYFAPTRASQRILAQAVARDPGPKGVHVAYVVVEPSTRREHGRSCSRQTR